MYLIVFRSKNETLRFSSLLSSYNFKNSVISTPKQISTSCGLSCKIDSSALKTAILILKRRQFYTFVGIFLINDNGYLRAKENNN